MAAAKKKYPRIARYPWALTKGAGEGWSETYEPDNPANPVPGKWNVQLRDPAVLNDPKKWADTVGFESLHALQANDPRYQKLTNEFVNSMTSGQDKVSRRVFARERQTFGQGKAEGQYADTEKAYQAWLRRVQAQEYIRGGIFTDIIPNWIGPKGEGQYTPAQMKLLSQIKDYLQSDG